MSSPMIVEHEKQEKMDGKDFIYFLEASVILYSEIYMTFSDCPSPGPCQRD